MTLALIGNLVLRALQKVDIVRDRAALARIVQGGKIENVYRLQIMNARETPQTYTLSADGLPGLELISDTPSTRSPSMPRSRCGYRCACRRPDAGKPGMRIASS